jgi:hypothetical protein
VWKTALKFMPTMHLYLCYLCGNEKFLFNKAQSYANKTSVQEIIDEQGQCNRLSISLAIFQFLNCESYATMSATWFVGKRQPSSSYMAKTQVSHLVAASFCTTFILTSILVLPMKFNCINQHSGYCNCVWAWKLLVAYHFFPTYSGSNLV